MNNDLLNELESNDEAPASIKKALLAEVNLIRDAVQIGTVYTADFFSAFLTTLSQLDQSEHP